MVYTYKEKARKNERTNLESNMVLEYCTCTWYLYHTWKHGGVFFKIRSQYQLDVGTHAYCKLPNVLHELCGEGVQVQVQLLIPDIRYQLLQSM